MSDKQKRAAWIIGGIAINVVIIVGLIIFGRSGKSTNPIGQPATPTITTSTSFQNISDSSVEYDESSKKVVIRSEHFENAATNKYNMRITVSLPDGTELYQSDYLKPGDKISEISFETNLEPGQYKLTIAMDSFDEAGKNKGGSMFRKEIDIK